MNPLGWLHRKFTQNNDVPRRNVSTGKLCSCFTTVWEVDEQQHYPEPKRNALQFRQAREGPLSSIELEAHGVEEILGMTPEFFHGFLTIGTLGSVSITNDAIIPKAATPFEIEPGKETKTNKNELDKMLENPNKKDTKENKNMVVCPLKEHYEKLETKEEENEQKTTTKNLHKKIATSSYKRSGKLHKGVKRETHSLHFMKKMLKKLDFTSRCNPTSAGGNSSFCDLTEKKPKVFQKSRKIHPEEADVHVTNPHNYEVDKICYHKGYNKEVTLEDDEDIMYPRAGTLLKETVSSSVFANKPINSQPTGRKAQTGLKLMLIILCWSFRDRRRLELLFKSLSIYFNPCKKTRNLIGCMKYDE